VWSEAANARELIPGQSGVVMAAKQQINASDKHIQSQISTGSQVIRAAKCSTLYSYCSVIQ
jgi:hypothetical protein